MNERIRELSKEAWSWAEQRDYTDPTVEFSDMLEQKFALLIIQECMRMCEVAQAGYLTHGLEKEAAGAISVKQYIEDYLGDEL